MADRGDTHYHVPTLNNWFLWSSLFFTLTMVWTVLDDASAEWKDYQRDFRAIELRMAEEELEVLVDGEGLLALQQELEASVLTVMQAQDARRSEIAKLEEAARIAKEDHYNNEQVFKGHTANLKWDVLNLEKARAKTGADSKHVQELEEALRETNLENARLAKGVLALAKVKDDAAAAVVAANAAVAEAEKDMAIQLRDLIRVQERIETLDPSEFLVASANIVRDFPGLDFIEPTLKVDKQVLPGIEFDLNFTRKTRIDMCTTCHMGVGRKGFEEEVQPYATHPNLDLYMTSKSPHPLKEFGCTVCHRGHGESLGFQHVDHRPADATQAADWYEKYHWHKQHHWDYPMLKAQHVEASCIQCHKTSMELIADDAPKLTEGYRLVERFGCYACHKIDWFPTKRRPGPSLVNMRSKLEPSFVESWISKPRDFRPSTWMPQVFHLENYGEKEVIVEVSNYGDPEMGRAILGGEWNDNAVAAITAFLFDNHDEKTYPAIPAVGDAERGREVMNISGCYACHNTAAYQGEELAYENLSDELGRYNTKGPNLRGVATKISPEWLFAWIKDPASYWHDTNMPNLRLSDRDAADITAYMMEDPDGIFTDVPEGWAPEQVATNREVLEEQARWYFQKEGRNALATKFENEWADDQALAVAVGKAFVMNQGCFSCHEIEGMRDMMPIGTELTNWASKTVDKLDFGLSYLQTEGAEQYKLILPDQVLGTARNDGGKLHNEDGSLPWLDHHYNDGWLARKLAHPRSFDLNKVKNPKEKLRMPWFDFTPEQIDSIATFVLGLTNDDVPGKKMIPTPEQAKMDMGHRALRHKNCAACHVIDQPRITFMDENSRQQVVIGEIMPFPDESIPPRITSLDGLRDAAGAWAADWEEDPLDSIIVRLHDVNADVGATGETVEIPMDKLLAYEPANGGDFVDLVTGYYMSGLSIPNPDFDPNAEEGSDESYPDNIWTWLADDDGNPQVEDVDGVGRFYQETERDKLRWTFAPPVLVNEGHKLQRDWFFGFLKDPYQLRQQMRVRMPSFHYEGAEAESIADYFAGKAREDWYSRYARTARLTLGRTNAIKSELAEVDHGWTLPDDAATWPSVVLVSENASGLSLEDIAANSGLSADKVRNIERGYAPEIAANFARLQAYYESAGFKMTGQVPEGYEQILRTSPTWLATHSEMIPVGASVAEKGVDCYQCHPGADGSFRQDPIAWAPALENARTRLREEWVREWVWSPNRIFPGTAMPENFSANEPQYQDVYPNSTNEQQIDAVLDWLYNMEGGAPVPATQGASADQMATDQLLALLRSRGVDVEVNDGGSNEETTEPEDNGSNDGGGNTPPPDDVVVETPEPVTPDPVIEAPPPPAGSGVISGRVTFDGAVPTAKPLAIGAKQSEGCCTDPADMDATDYSLQVDPATKGIANVVVTLEAPGATPDTSTTYKVDQKACRFTPHIVVMPEGANIEYINSDSVSHNVHTYAVKNAPLNKTIAGGASATQTLGKAEIVKVTCDLHPWMASHVYVTDGTHWGLSGTDGVFSITGVPPGTYKLTIWHEKLGKAKANVTVDADGNSEVVEVKMGEKSGGGRRRR